MKYPCASTLSVSFPQLLPSPLPARQFSQSWPTGCQQTAHKSSRMKWEAAHMLSDIKARAEERQAYIQTQQRL